MPSNAPCSLPQITEGVVNSACYHSPAFLLLFSTMQQSDQLKREAPISHSSFKATVAYQLLLRIKSVWQTWNRGHSRLFYVGSHLSSHQMYPSAPQACVILDADSLSSWTLRTSWGKGCLPVDLLYGPGYEAGIESKQPAFPVEIREGYKMKERARRCILFGVYV